MLRWGLAAVLLGLHAGCGPLTLDVSSPGALQRTAREMRETMTDAESARFDEALFYLVGTPSLGKAGGELAVVRDGIELLAPLAGRTADGIVAEARLRRISEVRSALAELESMRSETSAARRGLSAFRFGGVGVYKRNRGFLEWPVIEFRIENNTHLLVSMVHFRAALLKPGHHEPWLVEEIDLVFFEGLAPGDRGRWRIEPELQEWIQLVDPHPDLEFVLEPLRLEAVGGRVLLASEFGIVEARRLEAFERTLVEIRSSDTLALDRPPLPSLPPLAVGEVAVDTALAENRPRLDTRRRSSARFGPGSNQSHLHRRADEGRYRLPLPMRLRSASGGCDFAPTAAATSFRIAP